MARVAEMTDMKNFVSLSGIHVSLSEKDMDNILRQEREQLDNLHEKMVLRRRDCGENEMTIDSVQPDLDSSSNVSSSVTSSTELPLHVQDLNNEKTATSSEQLKQTIVELRKEMQQVNEERKSEQHEMEKEELRDDCDNLKRKVDFARRKVKGAKSDGLVVCNMLEEQKYDAVLKLATSEKRVLDLERLNTELHVKTEQLSAEINKMHKKSKTNTVPSCR